MGKMEFHDGEIKMMYLQMIDMRNEMVADRVYFPQMTDIQRKNYNDNLSVCRSCIKKLRQILRDAGVDPTSLERDDAAVIDSFQSFD